MEIAIALSLLTMVSVIMIFLGFSKSRSGGEVQLRDRMNQYAMRDSLKPASLDDLELERPFSERVVVPLVRSLGDKAMSRTPQKDLEKIRRNIILAGNPPGLTAESFLSMKMVVAIALAALGLFVGIAAGQIMYAIGGVLLLGWLGYILPGIWLGGKIRTRQKRIMRGLPDALDLMTICLQAGAGLDGAMQKVVEKDKSGSPLAAEFRSVLKQMQLGKTRSEALKEMADRCGTPDTDTFIAAVVQADSLGLGMVHVLEIQSDQMRLRRRQRAEALAAQAPIKMLFPMIFLMFPSMFIVILGPAVPSITEAFASINK